MKSQQAIESKHENLIRKLQKNLRISNVLRQFKNKTGIDLKSQSQKNLHTLYSRLRNLTGIPQQTRDKIGNAKRPDQALTPAELKLFKTLLDKPLLINHATDSAAEIKSSGYFYSTYALARNKISKHSHTSDKEGEDHFVFFSLSYSHHVKTVDFLSDEDVFVINYDNFIQQEPELAKGCWVSGHFYAYHQKQISHPVIYQINEIRTLINLNYEVSPHDFEYKRTFTFIHNNDLSIKQTLLREEEISCGHHIKTYNILRFIEYLRFIEINIRAVILSHADNFTLLTELYDTLFTPGKAELHIPDSVPYNSSNALFINRTNLDKPNYDELLIIVRAGDCKRLKLYEKLNFKQYRYAFDGKKNLSLLNIAVFNQHYEMTKLLIQNGLDVNHAYQHYRNNDVNKNSLLDSIDHKNLKLIQLLCNPIDERKESLQTTYGALVTRSHLYLAIAKKVSLEIFAFLFNKYSSTPADLTNFFILASYYDFMDGIKLLLNLGVNPNSKGDLGSEFYLNQETIPARLDNKTALIAACTRGNLNSVKLLIDAKADVNAYIKTKGYYEEFGKGESPLLIIMNLIIDQKQAISSIENLVTILKILIQAGADLNYRTGSGVSFASQLKKYCKTNQEPDPYLKNLSQSIIYQAEHLETKDVTFIHEGYSLIMGLEERDEQVILVGTRRFSDTKDWLAPGGQADYQYDNELFNTALNYTISQTKINFKNLQDAKSDSITYKYDSQNQKMYIEVHEFKLPGSVEQYPSLKQKMDFSHFLPHTLGYDFEQVEWVKLKDIEFKLVAGNDVQFPIFFYKERQFSYNLTMSLIKLCKVTGLDIDKVNQLVAELLYNNAGRTIFDNAIKVGDSKIVQKLIQLGVHHFHNSSVLLSASLANKQEAIAELLINLGIRYLSNDLYYSSMSHFSDDFLILFYNTHQNLFYEYYLSQFSYYAAKCHKNKLSRYLLEKNNKLIEKIREGCFAGCNIKLLRELPLVSTEEIEILLHQICHDHELERNSSVFKIQMEFINGIINDYRSQKISIYLLRELGRLFSKIMQIENLQELIHRCLNLLEKLIKIGDYSRYNAIELFGTFLRLKHLETKTLYLKELQQYLDLILEFPLVAIQYASRMKKYEQLDALLDKYHDDDIVKDHLISSSWIINPANHTLNRAINKNLLNLLNLILEISFSLSEFNVNHLDENGNTPLDKAILLGHDRIAEALLGYGAKQISTINAKTKLPSPEEKEQSLPFKNIFISTCALTVCPFWNKSMDQNREAVEPASTVQQAQRKAST